MQTISTHEAKTHLSRYLAAVAAYDRKFGVKHGPPRHYPGSPRLIRAALRPQDRFVACEMQERFVRLDFRRRQQDPVDAALLEFAYRL